MALDRIKKGTLGKDRKKTIGGERVAKRINGIAAEEGQRRRENAPPDIHEGARRGEGRKGSMIFQFWGGLWEEGKRKRKREGRRKKTSLPHRCGSL